MPLNQEKMLQAIYDTLFSAFTSPPPGLQAQGSSQAEDTYLILAWPGMQVDPAQFANPWSPNNVEGSVEATERFSTFVDDLPSVNPMYSPNGGKLTQVFDNVVHSRVVPPPEDPDAKAAYVKANSFLHAEVTDYDDEGKPIKIEGDSPVYRNYKKKFAAYSNAVTTLMTAYFQYDMSNPSDQQKWSLLGPSLQGPVETAWDDLQAAHATKIEDALATLAQSSNNQVGVLFNKARKQFESLRRAGLSDPTKGWWPTYASPANWFASSAADQWTTATIDSKSLRISEHSDYTKMSTGGKASWGLWSVGGSFSKEDSHEKMSKETDDLKVSFKFARIAIERPWYNHTLLGCPGWVNNAYPQPGSLSNGTRDQESGEPYPLLPTSFIAVRDVSIAASWGTEDSSLVTSKLDTKASVGWGPFAISGSYSHGSTDRKFASDFDGRSITNPGLQIIGWVNSVVPKCPQTATAGAGA